MDVIISKSKKKDKKFDALINGKKTISFGAKGYSDYTINKDLERKKNYLNRHRKTENWKDPNTAGFYATNLLWNKTTLKKSIDDVNKNNSKINIKLNI
jgi:hypothetical protein